MDGVAIWMHGLAPSRISLRWLQILGYCTGNRARSADAESVLMLMLMLMLMIMMLYKITRNALRLKVKSA